MKRLVISVGVVLAISLAVDASAKEPVLMLNEPRDITTAEYSCRWAEGEIKSDQYLIKAFRCGDSDLCQRAIDINAVCKVRGPLTEVGEFHSKLLAQFASNTQCSIEIMRLTEGKSLSESQNDLEAFRRADWELNLSFIPGKPIQEWALWPHQSGKIIANGMLQGEGDPTQIARDVCNIMTHSGAKILN